MIKNGSFLIVLMIVCSMQAMEHDFRGMVLLVSYEQGKNNSIDVLKSMEPQCEFLRTKIWQKKNKHNQVPDLESNLVLYGFKSLPIQGVTVWIETFLGHIPSDDPESINKYIQGYVKSLEEFKGFFNLKNPMVKTIFKNFIRKNSHRATVVKDFKAELEKVTGIKVLQERVYFEQARLWFQVRYSI